MAEWTVQQDLRQAVRMLRRQPAFAAAAIAMVAFGTGATTAIFSVVKSVLIDPLPYPNSSALVRIVHNIGGIEQSYFNDAIITTYIVHSQAFESVGVWIPSAAGATITGDGEPEEVRALTASRGFFTTLGVPPIVGRWFSVEEDGPRSADTAVIGAAYWRQKYGGDPGVVGRTIVVNGRSHQIVGVMPAHFAFGGEFDVLLPLRIDPARPSGLFRLNGVALLKPGVTLAQANADVSRILEIYFDTYRTNTTRAVKWTPSLVPLKQDIVGDVGPTLWVLMGTIALVLVMACSNIANLLLVRAESRRQEFAIRCALGAKWTRVARALLVESMTLALIGGALGVAIAYGGLRLLVVGGPANLPRLAEVSIDTTVLLVAVGLTLVCGLLFSLMPIAKSSMSRFTAAVSTGGRGLSVTRERQRAQNTLVGMQIALALVLLVSSGLMIRSFQALRNVAPGFTEPHTLQAFNITIPASTIAGLDPLLRRQQDILGKITTVPGVQSAAFTTRLPMDPSTRWSAALSVEDKPDEGRTTPPNRQVKVISPGAFQTFGTPLVAGRDFTWTDLYEVRDVAIVSENLAREFWDSAQAAVGKRIRQFYGAKGPWREVVGVAGDVHDDGAHRAAPATVYWPARLDAQLFAGYHARRVSMVVRTNRAGTESVLEELRRAVWSIDPSLPLASATTLDVIYERSMSRTSFTLVMLAVAGVMALLLGISGIYGVIAYAVAQRRREIGIRIALGGQARAIRALFLRRGIVVTAAGVVIGLAAAAGVTRLMQSLLFGIEPLDPLTFATMPIVLVIAAILATYVSARRALNVDPVETMKGE